MKPSNDDDNEDISAELDATALYLARGGFYSLEKGKLSKIHAIPIKGWAWMIYILVGYVLFEFIRFGIEFSAQIAGMSSVATAMVENPAIIYIFPGITIIIAFFTMMFILMIIMLGATRFHWHLRIKTVILLVAIDFTTYLFYYFLANAANASTVLVTSPSDPYLARYYVGVTFIGEVYGSDILLFWQLPIAFGAIDAILIYVTVKEMRLAKNFDTSAVEHSFTKEVAETKHFECTLVDKKGVCEIQ